MRKPSPPKDHLILPDASPGKKKRGRPIVSRTTNVAQPRSHRDSPDYQLRKRGRPPLGESTTKGHHRTICEGTSTATNLYDCGCDICALKVRQKNARGMRRAILLAKRTTRAQISSSIQTTRESQHVQKEKKVGKTKIKVNQILECPYCSALVWTSESTGRDRKTGALTFSICCNQGQIRLPPVKQPPSPLDKLIRCPNFRAAIRMYNAILSFTSIGAKLDYNVVYGRGPFTFRIQGQNYHRIGSLLPMPGNPPKFLQLYIFDTANEVNNRLKALGPDAGDGKLEEETVKCLIEMLDSNNCLAKVFRRARDQYEQQTGEEFTIRLISDKGKGKQYDLPQTNEVAGLIVGEMSTTICQRDVILQMQSRNLQEIRDDHPLYMSLQYPLLFPYGDYGFHTEIPLHRDEDDKRKREFLSIRQYYAYQIHTRLNEGMTIVNGGRLFHQYVVDAYAAIEQERLRWAKDNQDKLRAELYSNIVDAVGKGDTDAKKIGKRFILPASFTGGPRYLMEKYHDAMAICRQYGNPDLFITMTANPNWPEVKELLDAYGGGTPNDRPDVECRVFKMKLKELQEDLKKGTFFKPYTAALHRIEFQKRGLPHAHMLLWFGYSTYTPSPEDVDKIISAELPNKIKDPEGYELVSKHMMHDPCGLDRPRSPCMANQVCTKKYPRPHNQQTSVDKSGYIIYRRRKKDEDFVLKEGTVLDNRFVIPHNIDILKKYKAHINVEWCNRTSAVKYLFKYISKGVDKATVVIEKGPDPNTSSEENTMIKKQRNEIQEYVDCRYLSACESMWRMYAFPIHKHKPSVQKLTIHLEGQQNITLKEKDNLGRVLNRLDIEKTMFTEWLSLNKRSEFARSLTYVQIPEYFVWNSDFKLWSERKSGKAIGRIVTIHPSSGDLYFLRIIVNKIKGPTSYEEIRTVGDKVYPDYKSACYARGWLDSDAEWHEAMDEANTWATPFQLRNMFVTFLIFCQIGSPENLWMHCWRYMSEDILYKMRTTFNHSDLHLEDEQIQQYTLIEIEKILRQHDRTLSDFPGLPLPIPSLINALGNTLWKQEMQYNIGEEKEKHDRQYIQMNEDQRQIYEAVLDSIDSGSGKLFFVYGAGGTGKTFLYKTIISKLRSIRKIVLPVASSGIAALLLPGGRTAHSRFNIPLNVSDETICHIKPGTMLGELLKKTDLIIWDEAPMAHRNTFEALDRTLKDIMSVDNPACSEKTFGGITVLLGGDFRQILPVIEKGSRADTVLASISQSYLWEYCSKFVLTRNMRLQQSDQEFAHWVLQVGEGIAPKKDTDESGDDAGHMVLVEDQLLKPFERNPLQHIADTTYGNLGASNSDTNYFTDRAILTPRNETVDEINAYMISRVEGLAKEYFSSDSFGKTDSDSQENETLYAVEYLNSLEFPGLPSHKICLKLGVPIMLMRNINQREGLCNGTRLIVTYLGDRVIEGKIITGTHVGHKVLIPRIILSEENTKHPFTLSRRQFPVRVCYAMTINKSQGQSLKSVLLYLPKPVFTHGQLYVALSRVTARKGLSIIQVESSDDGAVKNIVYKEIYNGLTA